MPRVTALLGFLVVLASGLGGCAAPEDEDTPADEAASADDAAWAATAEASIPASYARGKLHSDLDEDVVANLRAVRASNRGDAKALVKVGDSITFSPGFLRCLGTVAVSDPELEETRTFFSRASWERQSLASTVGWHTWQPLEGSPSPLDREIDAMRPAYAVVMLGTNDTYAGSAPRFARDLRRVVDALVGRGIVPVVSTIPHRASATANAAVPAMNSAVRSVAAAAKVPLVDYHLALEEVPGHGLSRDGVHPFSAGSSACDFSANGNRGGYNVRNRVTLEALDRVRRALGDGPLAGR